MSTPKVTVLMPVYNGERYLKDAMESILGQTFTDFEFLIIDDGSSDKTVDIVNSYIDKRIRLIRNEQNIGLIKTLNKGIELAQGEYIARMDCDDISLPQRLEKQINNLDKHAETCMVACHIIQLNADGIETGYWDSDINTKTFSDIYSTLPKTNCIAHPSVMIRKTVVEKYKYSEKQKGSEDWDLWLRLVASGQKIDKVNEVLLQYRVHIHSVTNEGNSSKKSQRKVIKVKKVFLLTQLSKLRINMFFFSVFYSWLRSIGRYSRVYQIPLVLRTIKRLITLNPFKAYKQYSELKNYLSEHTHNLFFFFPYTHIGGAERVHADIVACVANEKPLVFFTGFSKNAVFLNLFENSAKVLNIPEALNYPVIGTKAMKLIADYINANNTAKTFGANSIFYNQLLNHLAPNVHCIDIKHSFIYPGNIEEYASIPAVIRLNTRVFIGSNAIEKARKFYLENNIPSEYANRIIHIGNYINMLASLPDKAKNDTLKVIYVGRSTAEKRVHIVGRIAEECKKQNIAASFQLIGDMEDALQQEQYPSIEFTGEVADSNTLLKIYSQADVLLITSNTEGMPMSIMEAMANGVLPISTPVGDVPLHVINNKTGFVTSSTDEEVTVTEMINYIKLLSTNRELLGTMSINGFEHAGKNFRYDDFRNSYRKLLIG